MTLNANYKQIYVPGQVGLSYEITRSNGNDSAQLDLCPANMPVAKLPDKFFLKTPDVRAPVAEVNDFKEFLKEFNSKEAIERAAKHLSDNPSHLPALPAGQPDATFRISKMLDKARFTLPEWGQKVDCLIYDYGHGEMLHKCEPDPELWRRSGLAMRVLRFAHNLARALQVLHNQGVVHSFLVPRNLLCERKPFDFTGTFNLVGFGYARLFDSQGKTALPSAFPDRDRFFRAPETRARDTYAAYWFPADIYSIGALLYYLLLRLRKSDEEARNLLTNLPADARRLKAQISETLSKAVPSIIRENENILKIIDSCLRSDQEQRFSCVEELMEAVEIARTAGEKPPDLTLKGVATEEDAAKDIASVRIVGRGDVAQPRYFHYLRHALAVDVVQKYSSLERGHLEVYGSRDRIVQSLCGLLASAKPKHVYGTVTLPGYWTDENLGSTGRFLTMNKHMVRLGVHIHRVFLVNKKFHELSEVEQAILEAQLAAVEAIEKEKKDHRNYGEFTVHVLEVDNESVIADFENVGSTVAYLGGLPGEEKDPRLQPNPEETVCLNFFSTAKAHWSKGRVLVTRTIKKVRYWVPTKEAEKRFQENFKTFRKYYDDGKSLQTYVKGGCEVNVEDIDLDRVLRNLGDRMPTSPGV
jgi:serine/threonine protein kinase